MFGAHYLINQKLVPECYYVKCFTVCTCRFVHAFTCAGMLPSQYFSFCKFAGMGTLSDWYIRQVCNCVIGRVVTITIVYFVNKYVECVGVCTEESMQRAVDQAKTVTSYSTEGEVSFPVLQLATVGGLLMHGMTLQPMHITRQFPVSLGGSAQ